MEKVKKIWKVIEAAHTVYMESENDPRGGYFVPLDAMAALCDALDVLEDDKGNKHES